MAHDVAYTSIRRPLFYETSVEAFLTQGAGLGCFLVLALRLRYILSIIHSWGAQLHKPWQTWFSIKYPTVLRQTD